MQLQTNRADCSSVTAALVINEPEHLWERRIKLEKRGVPVDSALLVLWDWL